MKLSTSCYLSLSWLVASVHYLPCTSQELVGVRVLLNNGVAPGGSGSCTTSDHDAIQLSLNDAFKAQGSRKLHTATTGLYLLQNYCLGECEFEAHPELCFSVCTGELTMDAMKKASESMGDNNATDTDTDTEEDAQEEAVIKHLHEVAYSEELQEQCDQFRATARAAILGIEGDGAISESCLSLIMDSDMGADFTCTVRVPLEELKGQLTLDEGLSLASSAASIGFGIVAPVLLAFATALLG